jgi:hypothetical protein
MRRSQFLCIVAVVAGLLLLQSGCRKAEETDTRAAARRCAEVAQIDEIYETTVREFSKIIPEEHRERTLSLLRKSFTVEKMKEATIEIMAKHFTTRELNAMTNFYSSPEGKSVLKKLGPYMSDVVQWTQAEVQRAVMEMRSQGGEF